MQEVLKHLTPQDRKIAEVGLALYSVHWDGIKVQRALIARSSMGKQADFDTEDTITDNKANVATVCQMCDAERKYFSGQLKLDELDP